MPRLYSYSKRARARRRANWRRGQLAAIPRNFIKSTDPTMITYNGPDGYQNYGLDQFAFIHYPFNTASVYQMASQWPYGEGSVDPNRSSINFGESFCKITMSLPVLTAVEGSIVSGAVEYCVWKLIPRRTFLASNTSLNDFFSGQVFQNSVYDGFTLNGMPTGQTSTSSYRNNSPLNSRYLVENFVLKRVTKTRTLYPGKRHKLVLSTKLDFTESITACLRPNYNNTVAPLSNHRTPFWMIQYRGVQGATGTYTDDDHITTYTGNYTRPMIMIDRSVTLRYSFVESRGTKFVNNPATINGAEPRESYTAYSTVGAYNPAVHTINFKDNGE